MGSFADLDSRTGEAEAARLWRDLQAPSVPLHHVVVTDDASMREAADALEIFRRPAVQSSSWRTKMQDEATGKILADNEGDAELIECAAELGGLAFSREVEVMIVEAGIATARELQEVLSRAFGQLRGSGTRSGFLARIVK